MSLILPVAGAEVATGSRVDRWRQALEGAGHAVEVIVVADPAYRRSDGQRALDQTWLTADSSGLAAASVTGLHVAAGDYLLVLDARHDFHPEDLPRMIEPLELEEADVVVALRTTERGSLGKGRRLLGTGLGWLSKRVLGAADPFSGLIAMTPELAHQLIGTFQPVGSRFSIDILFRARGRKVDAPVRAEVQDPTPIGINDLRHVKRLADDTFGTVSRLIQFCFVGASGMVVDLSCYALFQLIFSRTILTRLTAPWLGGPLDLAVAGALSIATALVWNFSLNRRLTFNDARAGSIPRQFFTYVLSNALGVALSFSLRLYLPAHLAFFGRHRLAAAVVGIVMATGISFSMARWIVFGRKEGDVKRSKSPLHSKRRGRPEGPALIGTGRFKVD